LRNSGAEIQLEGGGRTGEGKGYEGCVLAALVLTLS
jgi:hypothetical protein